MEGIIDIIIDFSSRGKEISLTDEVSNDKY
jgi:hypothetical protein